jgi:hypothetical protein
VSSSECDLKLTFSDLISVALGKASWQNDEWAGTGTGPATRGNDGNTDRDWYKYSCPATSNLNPRPFWAVDLADDFTVTGVSMWNRMDFYGIVPFFSEENRGTNPY